MSLETPVKIRSPQRKLYCKAKAEPAFRFYLLYDKICREDILRHAHAVARANAGAPGVDGEGFATIAASGVEEWLAGLSQELITEAPERSRITMSSELSACCDSAACTLVRCRVPCDETSRKAGCRKSARPV